MASENFEALHFTDLKEKIDGKSPLLGALFLFFFFFFTFFSLYFLYICTRHQTPPNSNTPPAPPPPRTAGLDPATIGSLPIFSYGSTSCCKNKKPIPEPAEADCAICLSMFQEGDKVKVLPLCRHGFHSDCVDKWLITRSTCPLCRAGVNPPASLSDSRV
ncbi:hypothetical protein ABFX02_12G179700 [Erythranthe guttata]